MDTKSKAIVYLSVTIVVLIVTLFYVVYGGDTTKQDEDLIRSKALVESLRLENDSLMNNEQVSVDKIDSTDVTIAAQDGTIVEIKYIYKDAKINLFSLSTDSSFVLFSDNLSKADSLRW